MITEQISPLQTLQEENQALSKTVQNLSKEVHLLQEQIKWFKNQLFGKRSEKIIHNSSDTYLPGMEEYLNQPKDEAKPESQQVPAHTRRKFNRNGKDKLAYPDDLPIKRFFLDIPDEEKFCPETGVALVQIGEEITHKLAHIPGSFYIREIIRPKYVHPNQEEKGVFTAELPESLLPKCKADESLLAEIISRKYGDHLPLYRIEEIFRREDVYISRQLLSQWMIRSAFALEPLYNLMTQKILEGNELFIDETPVKMQDKGKCKQAYIWVLVGGGSADPPYRVYDFRETRSHSHAFEILKGFKGGVHSDKYGAYQKMAENKEIIWYPCWAHIRRKFFEAESGDPELRKWILKKIRHLFMFERVAWGRSAEERLAIRQEKEVPIIDELIEKVKEELINGKLLPKSKLREALGYFYSLIPYLKNYTKNPFARMENNTSERAVKPLAIGRKNWLFLGSPDGGKASATLFSLVQTCRGLKIDPRKYLEDVMRRIMGHNSSKLDELLPDAWAKANRESSDALEIDITPSTE